MSRWVGSFCQPQDHYLGSSSLEPFKSFKHGSKGYSTATDGSEMMKGEKWWQKRKLVASDL
jgi:hypothetical protein